MTDRTQTLEAIFLETIRLHERVMRLDPQPVLAAADAIENAFRAGGQVLAFGNGGSAADAQHLAAEFVGRFTRERRALPAIALTTDTSVLTSVGNDYGYEHVFARQIDGLGRQGDIAFAISTSGRSQNVHVGVLAATAKGLKTVALTGCDGGSIGAAADIHINVPDRSVARVQEVHRTILHAICELVERAISGTEQ